MDTNYSIAAAPGTGIPTVSDLLRIESLGVTPKAISMKATTNCHLRTSHQCKRTSMRKSPDQLLQLRFNCHHFCPVGEVRSHSSSGLVDTQVLGHVANGGDKVVAVALCGLILAAQLSSGHFKIRMTVWPT
jgi:hypothetical protein